MTNKHREKEIPEEKINQVKELAQKLGESNAVVIVSIKNVPAKQLQQISKKLRGEAEMLVCKNSIATRALDKAGGKVEGLKDKLQANIAFLFSELDPFELASRLTKNKSKARAREGQEVDEKVVVQAGPTEMTPGPVISELGDLGIPFEIKEGKINIKESKDLLEEGDKAGPAEVSIMTKLGIKPVEITLEPLVAYDGKDNKLFEEVEVDSEKAIAELKEKFSKALGFAVSIEYICGETISYLLARAASHEKALSEKIGGDEEEKEEGDESEGDGDEGEKEEKKEDDNSSKEGEGDGEEKKEDDKGKGEDNGDGEDKSDGKDEGGEKKSEKDEGDEKDEKKEENDGGEDKDQQNKKDQEDK